MQVLLNQATYLNTCKNIWTTHPGLCSNPGLRARAMQVRAQIFSHSFLGKLSAAAAARGPCDQTRSPPFLNDWEEQEEGKQWFHSRHFFTFLAKQQKCATILPFFAAKYGIFLEIELFESLSPRSEAMHTGYRAVGACIFMN